MILTWWQSLGRREKLMIGTGLIVLAITVIFLILEPVMKERQRMAAEIPRLREDLAWMKDHAEEVQRLRVSDLPVSGGIVKVLTPVAVENALSRAGLQDKVSDMKSGKNQEVMITFEEVSYGNLVEFLYDLNQYSGAEVSFARINQVREKSGVVKAGLTLVSDRSR